MFFIIILVKNVLFLLFSMIFQKIIRLLTITNFFYYCKVQSPKIVFNVFLDIMKKMRFLCLQKKLHKIILIKKH